LELLGLFFDNFTRLFEQISSQVYVEGKHELLSVKLFAGYLCLLGLVELKYRKNKCLL